MSVAFSIQSDVGTIPLVSDPGVVGVYRLMKGTTGLGLPPEVVRTVRSAGGGSTYRGTRVGERTPTLVIEVNGSSRSDTDTRLRDLARAIAPEASPQLVAEIEGVGRYRLGFYRTGGGEEAYAEWGDLVTEWSLEVTCPAPFWVGDKAVEFTVRQSPEDSVGLLPDLAELPVMSSAAYGQLLIENPGDVRAPIAWRITGPGGVSHVAVGGRGFTVHPLDDGETVVIQRTTAGWRVTDLAGNNAYPKLGPAPKFPFAPVGSVAGAVLMETAGEGASISGWFSPLRKLVY